MIKIVNLAKGTEILLYDEIGFFGTDSSDFVNELKDKHKAGTPLSVRINSPGGSVLDGIAIYNAIARIEDDVTVHIDGVAASIASYIAMAGDKLVMASNAFLMIHNPLSLAGGDSEDLRRSADLLDSMRDTIANAYIAKTGKDTDEIINLMSEETWFTAQEAKDMGFADEIGDEMAMAANAGEFPKHDYRNYEKYQALRDDIINELKTFNTKDKEVNAMDEINAELVAKQNDILKSEVDDLKAKLAESTRAANVASTKIAVTDALAEAKDLPERCKKSIRNLYTDAESCDGIDSAIEEHSELVAELKAEFSAEDKTDDGATVSDLGVTNQAVNSGETDHETRIQNWLKANNSTDYRAALIATATLEG
jgi:ATP-dependent Clp endopeptidase proteolytic subunit ClpP